MRWLIISNVVVLVYPVWRSFSTIDVHVIDGIDELLFDGSINIPVQGECVLVKLMLISDGCKLGLGGIGWNVGAKAGVH